MNEIPHLNERRAALWVISFILVSYSAIFYFVYTHPEAPVEATMGASAGAPDPLPAQGEAAMHQKYGTYLQKTKDGKILKGDTPVNEPNFKKSLLDNQYVNVYTAPCGDGYELVTDNATNTVVEAVGCEAAQRSGTFPKNTGWSLASSSIQK